MQSLAILLFLLIPTYLFSQSGMMYDDFKRKLEPYFAEELVKDIDNAMPQGAEFRIWGWDVGDFSADGFNDVALSINITGTRKRECIVYLFIDNDGYLVNVSRYTIPYIDLPLEVGVVIRDTTCYVVQKRRSEYWMMKGYRYRYGSVVLYDEFISNRIEMFAHEGYRNYLTLNTKDKYLTQKGEQSLALDYLTIPCYERGRHLYAGIASEVKVENVGSVNSGAFYWYGPQDASFRVRMVYDDDYMYIRIAVTDSSIVTGWCDTCISDRLELWLDVTPSEELGGSRYIASIDRSKIQARNTSDSGLYSIGIKIGDFADKRPSVTISTTDDMDVNQDAALQQVRVVTAQRSDGYIVKIRIPFALIGYARVPLDESGFTELGCSFVLYDVDNDFRPEETTVIATSRISPLNPSSYGTVIFVPNGMWYGETSNIFADAVLGALRELGF